jgi:glycerol-3-phosphate acyltransferase PlsX
MPLNNITIAVDAMGGDHGPTVIVPAALEALKQHDTLKLILVGDSEVLRQQLQHHQKKSAVDESRLVIHHTSQTIAMDESPAVALRTKKDSSMRVAINLVKDGSAHACVSAGNTGALMATASFVLKTLPGIDRPAIISTFPTYIEKKNVRILDLGANVDSTAERLLQFAVMGSVVASAVDNIPNPKVYLLNIGAEAIKGNEQVKQAAQLLSNLPSLNYAGFIEGNELYKGEADVVVCDGFIGKLIKRAFYQNTFTKLAGMIAKPALKMLIRWIDPDRYNGASLIGLKGIVIKSHGGANCHAFANAIGQAIQQVDKNIPSRISAEVERLLADGSQQNSSFFSWK